MHNVMNHSRLPLIHSPFKTQNSMNKKVKMILQAISYVITLILGAAGGATVL